MRARPLIASDWIYRMLLQSYPAAFRDRFAAEMAQVFRILCGDAYAESGAGSLARLWLPALSDWAWSALHQWRQSIFKRRTEMAQMNSIDRTDSTPPLSIVQATLAALPFVAFGASSLISKMNFFQSSLASLPLWHVMLIHPYLLFNWLILVGLGISLVLGFPRWGYSYLGWVILFAWWWSNMRFYGYELRQIWLPLLGVVLVALIIRRSFLPLHNMFVGLWNDWTMLSFALYILYGFVFMLYDENHNPYLFGLIAATTLAISLGAWGYFRAATPLRRVLALIGGVLVATIISVIDNATWDYQAYYGLPESATNVNLVGLIFFAVLTALMLANGLIAHWRCRHASRLKTG